MCTTLNHSAPFSAPPCSTLRGSRVRSWRCGRYLPRELTCLCRPAATAYRPRASGSATAWEHLSSREGGRYGLPGMDLRIDGFRRTSPVLLDWAIWQLSSRICFASAASSRPEALASLCLRGSHRHYPTTRAFHGPWVEIEIRAACHTCAHAQGPGGHSEITRNTQLTLQKPRLWAAKRLSRKSRCKH